MDVPTKSTILLPIPHSMVIETCLPNFPSTTQLLLCPKRKSALDQLQRPFQSQRRSNQQVKMIWHNHKLMEQKFL